MSKTLYYLITWLLCALCLGGNPCGAQSASPTVEASAAPAVRTPEEKAAPIQPENLVHFGDVIDVDIVGSAEYDWRGRINPEGFLDALDYVEEPIYALCRSEEAIAADIAKGYSKLLRNPRAVVKIIDKTGRPNLYLYGAVKTPQRFILQRQVYLNELIVLAGGITDQASGDIQILRPSKLSCNPAANGGAATQAQISGAASSDTETKTLNIKIADLLKGDKRANPLVESGDIITVAEAAAFYIIGGVMNPKQINVVSKITVSRAIAAAGGLSRSADPKNITIFRRTAGEPKVISVDLEKIKAEKAEDIVLQKFDVVEVGETGAEKRKFSPIIRFGAAEKKSGEMPLRIIR